MFGRFWPDAGVPGNVRAVLACLGVGLLAAIVLPFRDLGIGTFLVLLAAGGVVLALQRQPPRRRSPSPAPRCACCWRRPCSCATRSGSWCCACWPAARSAWPALVNGRTLPAFVLAGVAWPLAALRGLPWLGRSLRGVTGMGTSAAALRTIVLSLLGVVVFGLLFASADAIFAEWVGALVPDLELDDFVLRGFITVAVGGVVLAATYLALNPPNVEPGVRPGASGRAPLRVAGAGAADRRRVPGVPRRPGLGHLRRPRVRREHHRSHLRRLRAPGLRPAHRGHRADAARRVGRRPQGAARPPRPT